MGGYDSFLEDFLGTSFLEPQKCVCDLSAPSWEVIDTVPGRWQKGQTTRLKCARVDQLPLFPYNRG